MGSYEVVVSGVLGELERLEYGDEWDSNCL